MLNWLMYLRTLFGEKNELRRTAFGGTLLAAQRFHRISQRRFDALKTHRRKSD